LQELRRVERPGESAALQRGRILRPLPVQGYLRDGDQPFLRRWQPHHRQLVTITPEGSAALQQQQQRDVRQSAEPRVHDLIESSRA